MKRQQDVSLGHATVPVHMDGGWALPGGMRTRCETQALQACSEFNAILEQQMDKTLAAGIPNRTHRRVITRRKVSGLDAERHTVSV